MRSHNDSNTPNFAAGVLQLAGGSILAQSITILTIPIISRLYEPDQYGTANILSSIVGILAVVVCLRYEMAISLPEGEEDAANLYALSVISSILLSALSGLLVWLIGNRIVELINAPELDSYLWIIPIGMLIQGLFGSANYWISRQQKYAYVSLARVCASLTTSAVPILLAVMFGSSSRNLIISWFAGTFVMAGIISIVIWKENGYAFLRQSHPQKIWRNLLRYRKFPLIDLWGGLFNTLSWQLPALLFSSYFSAQIVGYYSLANRVLLLPITLIGGAVSQVFFQRTASLRSDPERLRHATITIFGRLAGIGLFPSLILALAGPDLFVIAFSLKWQESGVYAQILGPWLFFLFISSPLSLVITALERQELSLGIHVTILLSRILALVIGSQSGNPRQALLLWTFTGIIIYGGLTALILKITKVSIKEAIRHLETPILLALPAFTLILLARYWNNSLFTCIIIGVSALFYYIGLLRHDIEMLNYVLRIFRCSSTTH